MSDAMGLLIVVCFTVFAFYALLHLLDVLDAQIEKRVRDTEDPDWWWKVRQDGR